MLIVQLSFYDAQLTSAGISPDPESVAKAVEEWLGRVTPKNRKFEYRSTVIAPSLLHTEKITRGVPQDPWESGLLCDHILIANTDAYQSEFIPRECDVLDSDLEMSTITFNIRIPRNIVDCYHLDVDDLHVVWKE
ncbi:hypothetical protein D915_008809 [Fasciola hepatica]|uniref:Uncharacterized protein n=1 Tax=Fasciola hepatica TaxID=6192 RepID=A0A4E0QZZ4_FASHE|nr:hypothetical protein D915_008809 [Fasciola hepatica]